MYETKKNERDTETERWIERQIERQIDRYIEIWREVARDISVRHRIIAYPVHSTRFKAQFVGQKKKKGKRNSGGHVATTLLQEDIYRRYVKSHSVAA